MTKVTLVIDKCCERRGHDATVSCMKPSTDPPTRILIIANDEPIGEIVADMLRTASYECDAVVERDAILEALKRASDYDLMFCQVAALEKEKEFFTWVLRSEEHTS